MIRAVLVLLTILTAAVPVAAGGHQSPLVIPAAAFHEVGADPSGFYYNGNGYLEGDGTTVDFVAAVYLPDGATVRQFRLNAYDNTDSCGEDRVLAWLVRHHQVTDDGNSMSLVLTLGSSSSMRNTADTTIDSPVIDNLFYTYWVHVTLCSSEHRVYSVEIDYTE